MATVSAERLAACKAYMRVDGDAEDTLIASLLTGAEEYLTGAGIYRTADNAARYDIVVHGLTLYYYDHRDAVGTEAEMPRGLRPVINQLKLDAQAQTMADSPCWALEFAYSEEDDAYWEEHYYD